MTRFLFPLLALLFLAGCSPKEKEITPLQRKAAATLVSEAEFALNLRDDARAENLYAQAAALTPDSADTWVSLGAVRKRLGRAGDAKTAYEAALKAHQLAYKKDPKNGPLLLEQVYILALLGRLDEAKAVIKKAHEAHGEDARVMGFTDKSLDRLVAGDGFKSLAL